MTRIAITPSGAIPLPPRLRDSAPPARPRTDRPPSSDPSRRAPMDERVGHITIETTMIIPSASAFPDVLLAQHDLARERLGDLERTIGLPWLMRAAAVA